MPTEKQKENTRKIERYYDEMVKGLDFANESERGATENISKTILTFTSGIIGLSVVFLSNLIKDTPFFCLLIISWVLLIFSGSIILIIFLNRKSEYEENRKQWGEKYAAYKKQLENDTESQEFKNEQAKKMNDNNSSPFELDNKYSKKNRCWTKISVILFIAGLVAFIVFASITLVNSNSDYDEKKNHNIHNCVPGAVN